MKLSIVTTLYYSAPYLNEFYGRIGVSARKITNDYEILFVNDGSPDNSLDIAIGLYKRDVLVKVIDLSRNFGHHKAMMTGLKYAAGEFVFLIDSDLEEEPELIEIFWKELENAPDLDVVYGIQERRKGGWFEQISGNIFYKMFNYFSPTKVPENLVTCRLMKKGYVDALVSFKEQEIFLAGIWAATGFNQKGLVVKKLSRNQTSYSFKKKLSILVNSLTSFTNKPLVYIFYLGIIISFFSFLYISHLIIKKTFFGISVEGWTSLIASIWFVGGIIIFSIGVLGIYLSKIFSEVKNRPYTIVKRFYARDNNEKTVE